MICFPDFHIMFSQLQKVSICNSMEMLAALNLNLSHAQSFTNSISVFDFRKVTM